MSQQDIVRLVSGWPEISPAASRRVAALLRNASHVPPARPSAYEREQRTRREESEAAITAARRLADEITACDVCGLQPDQHLHRRGPAVHDWVPGRAEKILNRRASK